ncbi:MAG: PQQ-dependent sugar dehydrogenase [Rhodovarius sp.]|nr:PQQ-dependent sugar dehydrogenase [Rhodovarius sp.]MCX7931590.1 PQQ-dependent sugar dehydrogenase [Rhodovarius sp.]MDW8315654.1 PQQ-dependent sugar dehydrogenase [Rhodovarius sp.]
MSAKPARLPRRAAAALLLAPALARGQEEGTPVETALLRLRLRIFATGLERPWGGAFLPDGRLLVTERPGRLRLIGPDGVLSPPLAGVPPVEAAGQGGLLDVALAPDFAASRRIWLTSATAVEGGVLTRLWRARLSPSLAGLEAVEPVLDCAPPQRSGRLHYGGRLCFSPDGRYLFLTSGERNEDRLRAQRLDDLAGKIIRLTADGQIPPDNPFLGRPGARAEIWSYGHRNPQGIAFHPVTGSLFAAEFGPLGGDELNLILPGRNYGWPVVTHGRNYIGTRISDRTSAPGMEDPVRVWVPSISPSGLAFVPEGALSPWRGHALLACLNPPGLLRLAMRGDQPGEEERLLWGQRRIRHVLFDARGLAYLLVDAARAEVLRLEPA